MENKTCLKPPTSNCSVYGGYIYTWGYHPVWRFPQQTDKWLDGYIVTRKKETYIYGLQPHLLAIDR